MKYVGISQYTAGEGRWDRLREGCWNIYIRMCKTDGSEGVAGWPNNPVLCDGLEEWDAGGVGERFKRKDMCLPMADSACFCMAKTNTPLLKQLSSN